MYNNVVFITGYGNKSKVIENISNAIYKAPKDYYVVRREKFNNITQYIGADRLNQKYYRTNNYIDNSNYKIAYLGSGEIVNSNNVNIGFEMKYINNVLYYNFSPYARSYIYPNNKNIGYDTAIASNLFVSSFSNSVFPFEYNLNYNGSILFNFIIKGKITQATDINNRTNLNLGLLSLYNNGLTRLENFLDKTVIDSGNNYLYSCNFVSHPNLCLKAITLVPFLDIIDSNVNREGYPNNGVYPINNYYKINWPNGYGKFNGNNYEIMRYNASFFNETLIVLSNIGNMYFNEMASVINNIKTNAPFDNSKDLSIYSPGCYSIVNKGVTMTNAYQASTAYLIPYIGPLVTAVDRAFNNARFAFGDPSMRSLTAQTMQETYRDCWNLTGNPVIGPNVKTMCLSYYNSYNMHGDVPDGPLVNNLDRTYWNCQNLDGVCGEYPEALYMFQTYWNCINIKGPAYIGPKVTNARQCYTNCYELGYTPASSDVLIDMYEMYRNCRNLSGEPVSGEKVTGMFASYADCWNITGNGACGPLVTDISQCYLNCYNLSGNAHISNKVVNAYRAYANCVNMEGAPEDNLAVTNLVEAYYNCHSLKGSPVMGNTKTVGCSYDNTFWNCTNMTGTVWCGTGSSYFVNMCYNCCNLGGVYIGYTGNAASSTGARIANAFVREDNHTRLNVVFYQHQFFNNARAAITTANCTFSDIEITDAGNKFKVNLPYSYSNGEIYGNIVVECLRRSFNEEKNVYFYAVT